ncbi:universal stress protein [Natronococcus wangiae]|uniref:universal stress protein n=1 Tax=Natronococcus wangiae TaxID=3068275 RepID=UPI00273D4A5C|nr:universal stress protein [Natronococcus sp. AD5]
MGRGRRLLVPVDGSDHSRQALIVAATEFDSAEIIVLHVLDPFTVASVSEEAVWDREFMERREGEAEELLDEYEAIAAEQDISVETEIAHGSPSRAILGAVDDFDIDHVVIGSRGRTGAGRVVLGSVAETVAKRAPVSVTIVRPDA